MAKATLATDGTLMFWCPGCDEAHGVVIDGSRGWTWNGRLDSPTISPSVHATGKRRRLAPDGSKEWYEYCCHSFVKDGHIQFLADCTHALAGKTVPLPDWEDV